MKQQAWMVYLAVAVFVGQYFFVSSVSSTPNGDLYTAISASGLVAILAGLVIHRPRRWVGWLLVAVASSLYLAGDYVYASLADDSPIVAFPSIADWLYLAMYPVLVAGLVMIRGRRGQGRLFAEWPTAMVAGASALVVLGVLYMNTYLVDDSFGRQAQVVASAYPLLDVVLVALAAWLVVGAARPAPAVTIAACALLAMVVGNAVFNVQSLSFSFAPGGVADLGWLGFTSLLGAAALHPSMAEGPGEVDIDTAPATSSTLWVHLSMLAIIPIAHARWGSVDDLKFTVPAGLLAAGVVGYRHVGARSPRPSSSAAVAPA